MELKADRPRLSIRERGSRFNSMSRIPFLENGDNGSMVVSLHRIVECVQ